MEKLPKNNTNKGENNISKILEEVEKTVEKKEKEMPPIFKLDKLIEGCNADNANETITKLRTLLQENPELGSDFKEKMTWEYKDAEEKRKTGDAETKQKAFYRLQTLTKINKQIVIE
jgi:hypothetical protein